MFTVLLFTVLLLFQAGREITTFYGHSKPVNAATFSQDGQMLVSASDDCTLKVWTFCASRMRVVQFLVLLVLS